MSRKLALPLALAAQFCLAGLTANSPANAAGGIPDYFFREWTVSKNCVEAHAGLAARVQAGLKFKIAAGQNGGYVFVAEDAGSSHWAANWNGLQLVYRPGTQMTSLPADFECIPGQENTSPFLAMSNYALSAEPYYELAHWYGIAKIRGQLEHILIFPNASATGPRAVIVMQSASAANTVQLDDNGVLHVQ